MKKLVNPGDGHYWFQKSCVFASIYIRNLFKNSRTNLPAFGREVHFLAVYWILTWDFFLENQYRHSLFSQTTKIGAAMKIEE